MHSCPNLMASVLSCLCRIQKFGQFSIETERQQPVNGEGKQWRGGLLLGGNLQIHVFDVGANSVFAHVLRQVRQRGEHGVVIGLVQPPARGVTEKGGKESERAATHRSTHRYLSTPRHAQTRKASPKMRCPSQILAATSRGMFFENRVKSQDSRYMSACTASEEARVKLGTKTGHWKNTEQ